MNDVLDFLRQQQSISLEQLCSFLRIPSVSADSAYAPQMGLCAEWVQNSMTEAGDSASAQKPHCGLRRRPEFRRWKSAATASVVRHRSCDYAARRLWKIGCGSDESSAA